MISRKAIFYFFGITMTIPFNFFITPHAYWAAKLSDLPESPTNHTPTNKTETVVLNEYQIFWYSSLRKGLIFEKFSFWWKVGEKSTKASLYLRWILLPHFVEKLLLKNFPENYALLGSTAGKTGEFVISLRRKCLSWNFSTAHSGI